MTMKTLTIVSKDKVGLLADISYVLSKSKVNIESIGADAIGESAIITLALSDAAKGKSALEAASYEVQEIDAVVVKMPDEPGALNDLAAKLSKEGISIKNMRTVSRGAGSAILALSVDKPKRTMALLSDQLVARDTYY